MAVVAARAVAERLRTRIGLAVTGMEIWIVFLRLVMTSFWNVVRISIICRPSTLWRLSLHVTVGECLMMPVRFSVCSKQAADYLWPKAAHLFRCRRDIQVRRQRRFI